MQGLFARITGGDRERAGIVGGVGAYVLWGLFPGYFLLLDPASPVEILAHRVVWTLAFMLLILAATRRLRLLLGLDRGEWRRLAAAAVFITINWGVFVYAVVSGNGSEAALGYFLNPLVSVLLGVALFGERLRRAQLVAVGIAAVAAGVLAVGYGRVPWLAVALALSWAAYGAVKKRVRAPAPVSLTGETLLTVPFAAGYLVWLAVAGESTFGSEPLVTALLLLAGVVTGLPLLLFGFAAQRVPLGLLGMLFYINPVLQLAFAAVVVREEISGVQWAGFGLVLVAVIVFSWGQLRTMRHGFRRARRGSGDGVGGRA